MFAFLIVTSQKTSTFSRICYQITDKNDIGTKNIIAIASLFHQLLYNYDERYPSGK